MNINLIETMKELLERGRGTMARVPTMALFPDYNVATAVAAQPNVFAGPRRGFTYARDLSADTGNKGGFAVSDKVAFVADYLRPFHCISRAGGQTMVVNGEQAIPSFSTGTVAYWLTESQSCPISDASFSNLDLHPRRIAARLKESKKLFLQAPAIADTAIRRNLAGAIGQALDVAAFGGLGGHEPLGMGYRSNLGTVTFGGAATWAKLAAFERTVSAANGEGENPSWIVSPTTREKLRSAQRFSGGGAALYEADMILDKPAQATSAIANDFAYFGNWSDFWTLIWGAMDISVDPYTLADQGQVHYVFTIYADMAPIRGGSFCRSTDSAAV